MTKFNINTRQLTYAEIGLKRDTFTDELIYMFRKANRSESSLCWWIISSNSWLDGETPMSFIRSGKGYNEVLAAAYEELLGIRYG